MVIIEKGIPIPKSPKDFNLVLMEVGDSFKFDNDHKRCWRIK